MTYSTWVGPGLTQKILTGLKHMLGTNALAYFAILSVTRHKLNYNTKKIVFVKAALDRLVYNYE
jgi:hypothetical protein